jgi:hypothetical protein
MRRFGIAMALCLLPAGNYASGQIKDKDLKVYFDGVTERGRALYEYDQAAWHGSDAFFALHPDTDGLATTSAQRRRRGGQ